MRVWNMLKRDDLAYMEMEMEDERPVGAVRCDAPPPYRLRHVAENQLQLPDLVQLSGS